MDDGDNLSVRTAKKITIQNIAAGKRKRTTFTEIVKKVAFLELDSSVSVWAELERRHIARPTPYNHFRTHEVESNFNSYLENLGPKIASLGILMGSVFPTIGNPQVWRFLTLKNLVKT